MDHAVLFCFQRRRKPFYIVRANTVRLPIAKMAKDCLRDNDLTVRVYGRKFYVFASLSPDLSSQEVNEIAAELNEDFKKHTGPIDLVHEVMKLIWPESSSSGKYKKARPFTFNLKEDSPASTKEKDPLTPVHDKLTEKEEKKEEEAEEEETEEEEQDVHKEGSASSEDDEIRVLLDEFKELEICVNWQEEVDAVAEEANA